jgi:hypothetical protein
MILDRSRAASRAGILVGKRTSTSCPYLRGPRMDLSIDKRVSTDV